MNLATDIVNKITSLLVGHCDPVYKHEKPVGIKGNFTVVNSLPVVNDHLDQVFVNVNVHVADFTNPSGIPNDAVIKTRSEAAITAINNYSDSEYDISLQQSTLFPDPETQTHYINLRFLVTILTQE